MSILMPMIMNTSISIPTNTTTKVHQMFTIMNIKVNMVLTNITILDIRQKTISMSIRSLNRDLGVYYRALRR
jgi:hypothetical protein